MRASSPAALPLVQDGLDAAASLPSFLASAVAPNSWLDPARLLHLPPSTGVDILLWEPIALSTLAGLSTCVGASVAFLVDNTADGASNEGVGPDLLAFSLALAGSVMITVCIVSIIPESLSVGIESVQGDFEVFGHVVSKDLLLQRTLGFAVGWLVYVSISQLLTLLPEEEELSGLMIRENEAPAVPATSFAVDGELEQSAPKQQSSMRLTTLLFLALLLHNFPEGLAVAFSAATDLQMASMPTASAPSQLASIVALSIALHNIPEGIAIAIPCMAARPDRPLLAFGLASLSGLAEPLGAFIGLTILRFRGQTNGQDMGDALAFVAGIMLAVAVCELIPEANRQRKECDNPDSFALGIAVGVQVMVLTELYLGA
ncbi:hypothetical protein ACHAXT_001921 [Thalassiosira profunda]